MVDSSRASALTEVAGEVGLLSCRQLHFQRWGVVVSVPCVPSYHIIQHCHQLTVPDTLHSAYTGGSPTILDHLQLHFLASAVPAYVECG